jgi:hypothetical protein
MKNRRIMASECVFDENRGEFIHCSVLAARCRNV